MKKVCLTIFDYVLKIEVFTDDLIAASCPIFEEEKLMYVLGGLDEDYDNVLTTITGKMLGEKVTIEDAKALLLSHESQIERRKTVQISPLPSVNLSVKRSRGNKEQTSIDQNVLTQMQNMQLANFVQG